MGRRLIYGVQGSYCISFSVVYLHSGLVKFDIIHSLHNCIVILIF